MNRDDIPPMTAEMAENIIAKAQAMFEVQIRQAVLEEREACAKACERKSAVKGGEVFAARIRERGEK